MVNLLGITDLAKRWGYTRQGVHKKMNEDEEFPWPIATINVRTLVFSEEDIIPYLSQVRKKFVLYNLKEIAKFGSLYTTRLYELIQEFKDTGYMIKSVDKLREVFAVGEKFKAYKDFKRRTFDHACKEINDHYKMNLGYEELKEGRKVIAIKFVFKKTRIHKIINQKTGIAKNFYQKPEAQTKNDKQKNKDNNSDILAGQLAFTDMKKELRPIQNILDIFPIKSQIFRI